MGSDRNVSEDGVLANRGHDIRISFASSFLAQHQRSQLLD